MISEIDIRDWDRAEKIIDGLVLSSEQHFEDGVLTYQDYRFLMGIIYKARSSVTKPKLPAILSWWKA